MVKDKKRVDRQNERGRGEQATRSKARHGFLDQTQGGGVGENGRLGGGNTGGNPAGHGKGFLWNCWRAGHLASTRQAKRSSGGARRADLTWISVGVHTTRLGWILYKRIKKIKKEE